LISQSINSSFNHLFIRLNVHLFDCSDVQTFRRSFIHTHGIKRLHDGSRISPDHAGYGPEGLQGERRPQSGSLCRRVQGEGHSLLVLGGGWEGATPPALIGLNVASQRSGCGGVANILPY